MAILRPNTNQRSNSVPVDDELEAGIVIAYLAKADGTIVTDPTPVGGGEGGAAGVQYTEGDVDATITGTALMWEDAADTLRAASVAKPLPVAQQGAVALDSATLTALENITADTELPDAAALADGAANPTTPIVGAASLLWGGASWSRQIAVATNVDGVGATASLNRTQVGALLYGYNGATFDRLRSDTTNGLDVDVTRLPALPAGTNNIGDVDVLSLPVLPAGDNNIGNVDIVSLPAVALDAATLTALETIELGATSLAALESITIGTALPAGSNNIGDVDVLTLPANASVNNNQIAGSAIETAGSGRQEVGMAEIVDGLVTPAGVAYTLKFARINATADGDNTVIAAVASKKIRVISYAVIASAAGTITFQDTAGTPNVLVDFPVAANGGVAFAGSPNAPAFETASGNGLEVNVSAGLDAKGHVCYIEV